MSPQQRSEETHSRILDAAEECFARYGYDAVGVAEICRCADVTKGAFYHHFASKQAVFVELLDKWLGQLDELLGLFRTRTHTVPAEMQQIAGMARTIFREASDRRSMFLEFWNKAAHDPAVWQATISPYRRYRAFFAQMIEDGIAEGSLRPVDPEMAANMFVSLSVGLILQGIMDPHGADWGQVALESIDFLLRGLAKENNP